MVQYLRSPMVVVNSSGSSFVEVVCSGDLVNPGQLSSSSR